MQIDIDEVSVPYRGYSFFYEMTLLGLFTVGWFPSLTGVIRFFIGKEDGTKGILDTCGFRPLQGLFVFLSAKRMEQKVY